MLISIIVPVYNVEDYLKECLDSILNQTYKNIEIILVDDGSKDNSGRICDEYANKYNNIFVIHKDNAGLGMARNTGLEYIHGDFVTFIDSDDYIDEDLIETLYKEIKKNNVDMCKSGLRRVDNEKNVHSTTNYINELFNKEETSKIFFPRMIGSLPDKKDSIEMCVCGALYNAKYIKDNSIKFPSERELISEDLVFNMEYMQYANGSCVIDYVGYNYRYNPKSLTRRYREDRFDAVLHFHSEMENRLVNYGYDEVVLNRLSRIFFIYLRACLAQEKIEVSGLKYKQALKNIRNICKNKKVKNIINSYPINKLGVKQKLFVFLVKYNKIRLIYLCILLKFI